MWELERDFVAESKITCESESGSECESVIKSESKVGVRVRMCLRVRGSECLWESDRVGMRVRVSVGVSECESQ